MLFWFSWHAQCSSFSFLCLYFSTHNDTIEIFSIFIIQCFHTSFMLSWKNKAPFPIYMFYFFHFSALYFPFQVFHFILLSTQGWRKFFFGLYLRSSNNLLQNSTVILILWKKNITVIIIILELPTAIFIVVIIVISYVSFFCWQ